MIGIPRPVTVDAAIHVGPGVLRGVVLTPAAAVSTLILYDNASAASGTELARLQAAASGGSVILSGLDIPFANGIYADIGGSGALATVYI